MCPFREKVPTTEICLHRYLRAAEKFPDAKLERVRIEETRNNSFEYAGEEFCAIPSQCCGKGAKVSEPGEECWLHETESNAKEEMCALVRRMISIIGEDPTAKGCQDSRALEKALKF